MAKVILIMTDTQRYDMVNANVKTGLRTPNLDKLAASGTRFRKAYTTSPVCQPARAAIFTGMYPHGCGGWTNSIGLSANTHSIGERLTDAGIHSAYIGKWHLDGGDYFGLGKCPSGWDPDYWYDMRNYLEELTPEERVLSRNAKAMRTTDFKDEFTFAHRCSDRAVDFIRKNEDEDYFLAVSYDEPHHPSICPPPYSSMYLDFEFPVSPNVYDSLEGKPDYQKVWAGKRRCENRDGVKIQASDYFGCNSYVDHEIGRVLQVAEDHAGDAVIIYTSDHGDFLSSHRLQGKGPAVYEEITHIPFFVSGKGISGDTVNDSPFSHIDIAPTVFDIFGIPSPAVFSGESRWDEWRGAEQPSEKTCFIEFGRYEVDHDGFGGIQPLRAAYDGRYKLSINLLSQDEFYDLEEDPHEMKNLIDDESLDEVKKRLHTAILDMMNRTRDPFRGYYWETRPWRKDASVPTWGYTGYTRQSEDDYEKRQLDYDTALEMETPVRKK